MTSPHRRRTCAATASLLLGVLALAGCSAESAQPDAPVAATAATTAAMTPEGQVPSAEPTADLDAAAATPSVAQVRDAFAGLQATLQDNCTPGNCAYFLGRVNDELTGLEAAMKADPQGPEHFAAPLAWTGQLWQVLGTDRSFANLKKHQSRLQATRDKINTWMQGHPEDYR